MKRTHRWKNAHREWYRPGALAEVQKLMDAIDVFVSPHWATSDKAVGLDAENLYSRPGRFIPVNGASE